MKKIVVLSASLVLTCHTPLLVTVVAQVRESWVATYRIGSPAPELPSSMGVDAAGNVYLTGGTAYIDSSQQYLTLKFANDGRLRWAARYRAGATGQNVPRALRLDSAGNCYVTGLSQTNSQPPVEVATLKYDPAGSVVWVARHGTRSESHPRALALDSSGNVYVAGYTTSDASYLTAKISPAGHVDWMREYVGPYNKGVAYAVAADAAGNVFVTGRAPATSGINDIATLKYSPDGTLLWSRTYGTPAQPQSSEAGYALTLDAAGNLYVTGGGNPGFLTFKYSNEGAQLWQALLPSQLNEWLAQHIALDNLGNVIIAGLAPSPSEGMKWGLAKYSPTGSNQWSRLIHPTTGADDSLYGMVVDAEGSIYATGEGRTGLGQSFIVTAKYAPDGTELWKILYKDPLLPYARPSGLALDGNNNVMVAGAVYSAFRTNVDYVVIKYEQAQSAPRLRMVSFDDFDGARLSLFALSNATYTIEASSNLKDWTDIHTVPNPTGTVELTDPAIPGVTQRFYRARSP